MAGSTTLSSSGLRPYEPRARAVDQRGRDDLYFCDKQDNGANEERERGRKHRTADDLAQLTVDGELRWRGHPCGERHG
jgi:hypothetical protein